MYLQCISFVSFETVISIKDLCTGSVVYDIFAAACMPQLVKIILVTVCINSLHSSVMSNNYLLHVPCTYNVYTMFLPYILHILYMYHKLV